MSTREQGMSAWVRPLALSAEVLLRELVDDGRTPAVRRFAVLLGQAVRDPVAVVVTALVLAQAPAFVVVAPGLLVFAAVAVERR